MPEENLLQYTYAQRSNPDIVSGVSNNKSITKNLIISIFTVILMAGSIFAGVYLVKQQQDIRNKASEDICTLAPDSCILIPTPDDSGSYKVEGIVYSVFLTDDQVRAFDPSVTQDGCYQVLIQEDTIYWNKIGTNSECPELVNIQVWATKIPVNIEQTVNSQCKQINFYDLSWNIIDNNALKNLKSGDKIYVTVDSTTSQGTIDQAIFIINSVEQNSVSEKKVNSNEIYYQYTIPKNVNNISVEVKLHHSEFGWF